MSEYNIRRYDRRDRKQFFELYKSVFDQQKNDEWFDWKYKNNPYIDHIPMIVATQGGELVGARPFFALPLWIHGDQSIALQPSDTMVHPGHRRNGLFTRMTEQAIEIYAEDHLLLFNFPNHQSRPGYLKLGWEIVSEQPSYYRIDNALSITKSRNDRSLIRLASVIATPIIRFRNQLCDRRTPTNPNVSINVVDNLPVDQLAELYMSSKPDEIHAVRNKVFYNWRFDSPDWNYTTYIAQGERGPEAAIITGTTTGLGRITTKLTDIVPLKNIPEATLSTLLQRIFADHRETDLFVAPSQGYSEALLKNLGFHSDADLPLSYITTNPTHIVRPLSDELEHDDASITDPESWTVTFAEIDTN